MPWFKASDSKPAEGERVLIHDGENNRIGAGLYADGRWYVEAVNDGRLVEASGVTHWAPLLDSEEYDPGED